MRSGSLRRGDVVEVRSTAEILATLDERGMLEGLPFMPEMLQFCGRRFVVERRAEKICDTIGDYTSRRLPHTVILDDVRCDGSGHDGCQAECRMFWKEAWLRPVENDTRLPDSDRDTDVAALRQLVQTASSSSGEHAGQQKRVYTCQATELNRASYRLSTWDPRPYVREYASGNVDLWTFIRVLARAVIEQPLLKLGWVSPYPVRGTRTRGSRDPVLGLQPGDLAKVKSKAGIAANLGQDGKNRGLWFDREMLPFCGGTYRVRQRVTRFIDDRTGEMIHLKTDSVTLDGVVCSGERSRSRWFCPRAIYPYWREAWLERADGAPPHAAEEVTAPSEAPETVNTHFIEHVGLAQVHGGTEPPAVTDDTPSEPTR